MDADIKQSRASLLYLPYPCFLSQLSLYKCALHWPYRGWVVCVCGGGGVGHKCLWVLKCIRALKMSSLYENRIFQYMAKIFCVEFQRYTLKFDTKYPPHALEDVYFIRKYLRAIEFLSVSETIHWSITDIWGSWICIQMAHYQNVNLTTWRRLPFTYLC